MIGRISLRGLSAAIERLKGWIALRMRTEETQAQEGISATRMRQSALAERAEVFRTVSLKALGKEERIRETKILRSMRQGRCQADVLDKAKIRDRLD